MGSTVNDKKPTTNFVMGPEAKKAIAYLKRVPVTENQDRANLTTQATAILKMALFEVGWPKWFVWEMLRKAAVK